MLLNLLFFNMIHYTIIHLLINLLLRSKNYWYWARWYSTLTIQPHSRVHCYA